MTRRIIDNTGEYRSDKYVEHSDPATHFAEARFELGETQQRLFTRETRWSSSADEYTHNWGPEGSKTYGRVMDADYIGADLSRAVAQIRRNNKPDDQA